MTGRGWTDLEEKKMLLTLATIGMDSKEKWEKVHENVPTKTAEAAR